MSALKGEKWWARQGSNLRPIGYEPSALTTELRALYSSARDVSAEKFVTSDRHSSILLNGPIQITS